MRGSRRKKDKSMSSDVLSSAVEFSRVLSSVPVGKYVAQIREAAGLTQAELAKMADFSPASISRVEACEKAPSPEELQKILAALNTPKAQELTTFLEQNWDLVERPAFDHPNRASLWEANCTLTKIREFRENPDLKSVFVRQLDLFERELRRLVEFLRSTEHQIAFIGCIGVGKSTAICVLLGLLKPGEARLDRAIVLETGAGGITICEVQMAKGPNFGIRIVPRSDESIRHDVEDFADYLVKATRSESSAAKGGDEEEGDSLGISKEVVRAIRNMSGLQTETRKDEQGRRVRIDHAKDLAAKHPNPTELAIQILTRMDLLRRNKRDAWYPADSALSPLAWLQDIFFKINNGKHENITLPSKIEVVVPQSIFSDDELVLKIVDTKGVDQTAERQDLECLFDDPRTLVVLCTRFNDSPDLTSQTLLKRAIEVGARDLTRKTALLVLPRPEEALAMKNDSGTRAVDDEEGYELKAEQIDLRLAGIARIPTIFFNSKAAFANEGESIEETRDRLVDLIAQYRTHHCEQISGVSAAVDHLIENVKSKTIELLFAEIEKQLNTWIEKNRLITWGEGQVQLPLIEAIETARYAGYIRASVHRHGDWTNLDFYYHLSVGARRIAVQEFTNRLNAFRAIVDNLRDTPDYSPAKEFLSRVLASLDTAVDEAFRNVQLAGHEAFRDELDQDGAFWLQCRGRWGQGPGYRDDIRRWTEERFRSRYANAQQVIRAMTESEWARVIGLVETMLKGTQNRPAASEGQL